MAEKRTIELEIQDNSKSLKQQYRDAVKELQNVAAAYGETSAEAVKAAQKAADLKDQIEFTNDLVGAFNPDAKFNALTKSFGGVLDGFQAVEGGLGLIGVEGEAVQETMLKVQSAMALSQGLQGLMEAKDSFKQLGTVAANALKGIRTGLAATGIGIFLVALGTVVAYWDDIKEAVSGVSAEQKALNEKTEKDLTLAEAKVSALNKQDNILKLQGKTEKQILQYKIQELDAAIKIAEVNLSNAKATAKAQLESAKRNRDILVGILDFINAPIKRILQTVDKIAKWAGQDTGLGKWFETLEKAGKQQIDVWMLGDTVEEGLASIKLAEDRLMELKNEQAGYVLAIQQIDKAAINDREKLVKDAQNKEQENIKQYNEQLKAYYDALEQERQSKITNAKEKELQEIANKYEQLYALADAAGQSDKELIQKQQEETAEIIEKYRLLDLEMMLKAQEEANKLRLQQEQEFQSKIDEIDEQNFQNRLQKSMSEQEYEVELVRQKYFAIEEEAKGNAEQLAIIEEAKNNELDAINEKYAKQEKERKKQLYFATAQMASDALNLVASIMETNAGSDLKRQKQAFNFRKAANLAQATIDGTKAVLSTYADTPGGPVVKGIAAAIAGGFAALQIAKIAKSKFEGGSSSGSNSPSGAGGETGGQAPQFNTIGTSGINQLATLQQQPTKAYVVSGEVTSAQSLDRNRLQNATL